MQAIGHLEHGWKVREDWSGGGVEVLSLETSGAGCQLLRARPGL
jgi:hypothetical protein